MSSKESEIKGVIHEALTPAASGFGEKSEEAGKILGEVAVDIARTARAIFLPVRGLVWGIEKFQEEFVPLLMRKASTIPPEKRVEPSLDIVGPSIEMLKYHGYKKEIRELIANLIKSSMDKDYLKYSHPSFVSIIKQLSGDEAKILNVLAKKHFLSWGMVRANEKPKGLDVSYSREELTYNGYRYLIKSIGVENQEFFSSYMDNLKRLQLIKEYENFRWDSYDTRPSVLEAKESIEKIEKVEVMLNNKIDKWNLKNTKEEKFRLLNKKQVVCHPTNFGERFLTACFDDEYS